MKKMSMKEVLKALANNGVLDVIERSENHWYVEDSESYYGCADLFFDEDGDVIEVKGE